MSAFYERYVRWLCTFVVCIMTVIVPVTTHLCWFACVKAVLLSAPYCCCPAVSMPAAALCLSCVVLSAVWRHSSLQEHPICRGILCCLICYASAAKLPSLTVGVQSTGLERCTAL